MSDAVDWDKEAEAKYESEREEIRYTSRISIMFSVLLLVGLSVLAGLVQLVRWGVMGESLIPPKADIYWFVGTIIWITLLPPVFEWLAEMRKLRVLRLTRLEMKIDALLDRQK
jgi:hypothetical protein